MFRSRVVPLFVPGLLLLSAVLVACGAPGYADEQPTEEPVTIGLAPVEEIQLQIMESFPVQVAVLVDGYLPDGCTEIDDISQSFDEESNTFSVEITTVRPRDKMCTEAIVPFEERVSLKVRGLSAGTYTVDVNGVTDTFTLDVDNELPE